MKLHLNGTANRRTAEYRRVVSLAQRRRLRRRVAQSIL